MMRNVHRVSGFFWYTLFLVMWVVMILVAVHFRAEGQTMVQHPGQFNNTWSMFPGTVPTSLTCLAGTASTCKVVLTSANSDPYVCAADFTATGQTITLQDTNGTLWIVGGGALGSGGNPTGWEWHAYNDSLCRQFPRGVYITSNGAGVTGSVIVKWN